MENILTTSDTQINSSTESQIINMDEINNVLDCFLYSGWDLDYFYNYFEIFYDNFFNVPLHRLPDKISEATYNLLCYFFCITKHPFNDIHIENDYFDFSEFVELYVDCILNLSHSKKEILRNENGMPIGITWFKDNDSDNPYIISHCSSYFEMNTYRFVKSLNTDCIYLDPETQNENCFSDNTKINVITAKKMFKNIFKNMTHEKIQPIFSFVNKKANEFNYLLNHKNLAIKSNYYYKICEFYNNSSYFKKIEDYIKESNYQDEIKKYNEILLFMYYFINLEEKITPPFEYYQIFIDAIVEYIKITTSSRRILASKKYCIGTQNEYDFFHLEHFSEDNKKLKNLFIYLPQKKLSIETVKKFDLFFSSNQINTLDSSVTNHLEYINKYDTEIYALNSIDFNCDNRIKVIGLDEIFYNFIFKPSSKYYEFSNYIKKYSKLKLENEEKHIVCTIVSDRRR